MSSALNWQLRFYKNVLRLICSVMQSLGLCRNHSQNKVDHSDRQGSHCKLRSLGIRTECAGVLCCSHCRWLTVSADHIVILILLLALAIKFVFFEVKDELTSKYRHDEQAANHNSEFCLLFISFPWNFITALFTGF
jgi:hypothetical protein